FVGGGKAVERSLDNPPLPMRLARMGHSVLWLNTHIPGARWHPAGFRAIDLRDAGIGGGIDFVGGGKAVERSLDNPPLPMRLARMGHSVLWLNTHISGARWHPAGFRAIDLRDAGIGGGIDFVGGGKEV